MANKVNHRRTGTRRSENATFYGSPCGNARDKAKGRRRWKRLTARQYRRIDRSGTVRRSGKLMINTVSSGHCVINAQLRLFRDEE